jgi:threonine/homoserine/homoserine lactone efflux protein
MTLTAHEIVLYAGALFILFATPGPVWVALIARALSGGFHAAWPLAFGVVVGDVIWPLLAILGVTFIVSIYADFLIAMKFVAVIMFLVMGLMLLRKSGERLGENSALTRPGMLAGFLAGLAVIIGNPKAILFYMGILPGFFDLKALTALDIAVICFVSAMVPFAGNLVLAASFEKVRRYLQSPAALRRTNIAAGLMMIAVAGMILVL